MKRTPLRRRSKKATAWQKRALHEKALRIAAGEVCQCCKAICGILDNHHYWTNRIGPNALRFVILGRECHSKTNLWLRERGLLALVNGTFAVEHPSVLRAEARYQELLKEKQL